MNKVYPIFKKDVQSKFEMILEKGSKRNYLLWLVGTHTGLRISDILSLKVSDLKGNILTVKEQKTGKLKQIKLSSKLKSVFKDYLNTSTDLQDDDFLFTSRQSKNKPMTRQRVHQIIKYISKHIGVDDNISTHSMRKTFAYNLYTLSNNNIALVMEALNHSKEIITLRYLCIKDNILNDLVDMF